MSSNIIKEQFFTWFKVVIKDPINFFSSPGRPPTKTSYVARDLEVGWCEADPPFADMPAGPLAANLKGATSDVECSPVFQSQLEAARWLKTGEGKAWVANAQTYRLFIHKQIAPAA